MLEILRVEAARTTVYLEELSALLRDAVESGASIGFVLPLDEAVVRAYWQGVFQDIEQGTRLLLVAVEDGQLQGTAQLALAVKPNAAHRAEVQKVLVHTRARQRGLGAALMEAITDEARRYGRSLLILDTRSGDPAEQLYRRQGFVCFGIVPDYARSPEGVLEPVAFYYRLLD